MITAEDIGCQVEDPEGRVGILRAVIRDYEDPAEAPGERCKRPTAFIRAEGGGTEWLVPPEHVRRAS
ncbi:hypothetical protein [Streptomyces sp. NBC_01429]|uniref:hypothetical protein n=1 Tax=Streptomyces sp. NBC_01429 TaxID=2903862 RepID=UPI002E29DF9E|nr:hypothetical protein [Streptomyces sp. NBC_01429]